jgi:hypothetical protein
MTAFVAIALGRLRKPERIREAMCGCLPLRKGRFELLDA